MSPHDRKAKAIYVYLTGFKLGRCFSSFLVLLFERQHYFMIPMHQRNINCGIWRSCGDFSCGYVPVKVIKKSVILRCMVLDNHSQCVNGIGIFTPVVGGRKSLFGCPYMTYGIYSSRYPHQEMFFTVYSIVFSTVKSLECRTIYMRHC